MDLPTEPENLSCSECGDPISETGYLPATEGEEYEPLADNAVCGDCGFNEIGMTGCAPELDDVADPGPDGVLLFVRATDDGFEVVSAKP